MFLFFFFLYTLENLHLGLDSTAPGFSVQQTKVSDSYNHQCCKVPRSYHDLHYNFQLFYLKWWPALQFSIILPEMNREYLELEQERRTVRSARPPINILRFHHLPVNKYTSILIGNFCTFWNNFFEGTANNCGSFLFESKEKYSFV